MNTEIVIVTALEEERDSVLALLPAHHKEMPTNEDIRTYFRSNLEIQFPNGDATTYGITVLCLLNYGRLEALNATKDAINRWHPRYVILVGIAGGIKQNEAALGDVLV